MRIVSYNRSTGRRAKEKVHHIDDAFGVGYQRDGLSGKRLPGSVLSLYFDGRAYLLELDDSDTNRLFQQLKAHILVKE